MKSNKDLLVGKGTPTNAHIPSLLEGFKTRVVTPLFTIPGHPNDILHIMKEREILTA